MVKLLKDQLGVVGEMLEAYSDGAVADREKQIGGSGGSLEPSWASF
jgi:hypothetical protein